MTPRPAPAPLRVGTIREGKRFGFVCPVCYLRELFDDKPAAKTARERHVATAAHRSALRAARRE